MSAEQDHAGATDGPTWYYTEHGDAVHTVQYCPALSSTTPIPAQSYYDVPGTRPICKICKRRSDANPYEDLERSFWIAQMALGWVYDRAACPLLGHKWKRVEESPVRVADQCARFSCDARRIIEVDDMGGDRP